MKPVAPWLVLLALMPLLLSLGVPDRPPPPETAPLWGVAIGTYPAAAERHGVPYPPDMQVVSDLGAQTVLLPVDWMQTDALSHDLAPHTETISDPDLRRTIRVAHTAGLTTALMPIFRLREGDPADWRGTIRPTNPEAWWSAYAGFIHRYARLAAEEQVGYFTIGSELSSMSGSATTLHWERLAAEVRQRFQGPLLYGANHDALDQQAPFPYVDIAGVSAYFPLADDADAPLSEMNDRANAALERVTEFRSEIGLPTVLLEVGYPSLDGAAVRPWDGQRGTTIDLVEQERAYTAMVQALRAHPQIEGALFWNWLGPGGEHDRTFTPRGKPAEAQLRSLLQAQSGSGVD